MRARSAAASEEASEQQRAALRSQTHSGAARWYALLLLLMLALAATIVFSMGIGAVHIAPTAIVRSLFQAHALTDTDRVILFDVRLPRVLASGLVGAALAVAGLMFQGLFRNPMADPYVIGSSGGAILGAALGIFFFSQVSLWGFSSTALLAFTGSVATMTLVYWVARLGGQTNVVTLLLAGFAVSTMLTNSSYFFELLDNSSNGGSRILVAWLHGSVTTPPWTQLAISAGLVMLATSSAFPLMRRLNTLALGDEYAQQLGLRVEYTRVGIILIGSLLAAIAVSLGGMISFAGLVVPHVARLLLGPDHVRLLPVTALGGAIFLMLADTIARSVMAPSEIPVGILMAILGGPFFLYLLRRTKRSYTV